MFILLAIILLFIVGFLIFIRSMFFVDTFQGQVKDASKETPGEQSAQRFFESCLQQETEKVFSTLLLQGGLLFTGDGGPFTVADAEFLSVGTVDFVYGIDGSPKTIFDIPKNFKGSTGTKGLMKRDIYGNAIGVFNRGFSSPYFGDVRLPKLCLKQGSNKFNETYEKFSCPPSLYNTGEHDQNTTIQYYLKQILSQKASQCAQESQFNHFSDIEASINSADILFGNDEIIVSYDGTIISDDLGDREELKTTYRFPYRVKRLYAFANQLLEKEIRSIDFNITEDYENLSMYDTYFDVYLLKDFPATQGVTGNRAKDDLLLITDSFSTFTYSVLPQEYYSLFPVFEETDAELALALLIENRRPYLETIRNLKPSFTNDYSVGGQSVSPAADPRVNWTDFNRILVRDLQGATDLQSYMIADSGTDYVEVDTDNLTKEDPTNLVDAINNTFLPSLDTSEYMSIASSARNHVGIEDFPISGLGGVYADLLTIHDSTASASLDFKDMCDIYSWTMPDLGSDDSVVSVGIYPDPAESYMSVHYSPEPNLANTSIIRSRVLDAFDVYLNVSQSSLDPISLVHRVFVHDTNVRATHEAYIYYNGTEFVSNNSYSGDYDTKIHFFGSRLPGNATYDYQPYENEVFEGILIDDYHMGASAQDLLLFADRSTPFDIHSFCDKYVALFPDLKKGSLSSSQVVLVEDDNPVTAALISAGTGSGIFTQPDPLPLRINTVSVTVYDPDGDAENIIQDYQLDRIGIYDDSGFSIGDNLINDPLSPQD